MCPRRTTRKPHGWRATARLPPSGRSSRACGTEHEPSGLTKHRKYHIISGFAGGVPERLKGADCKSVGLAPTLVRIQPPPPGHLGGGEAQCGFTGILRGRRVELNGRAEAFQAYDEGSIPFTRSSTISAHVAQW